MNFTPKSEKELAELNLLPEGDYPFQVMRAADEKSKTSGNDMIVLDLMFFAPDGSNRKVMDYLVPSTVYGIKKIHGFAKATGLLGLYDAGKITADDCVDKTGYAKLGISKGKDNGKGGLYPDRNAVKWYITKDGAKPAVQPSPKPTDPTVAEPDDEDVPF